MTGANHPEFRLWSLQVLLAFAVSMAVTLIGILLYDHLVAQPGRRLGVVDLAAIYRAKEDEYARAFYRATTSERAPGQTMQGATIGADKLAQDFAHRLPLALVELRRECHCVIVVRGAVATLGEGMVDLTPALRGKLGMQP